MIEIISSCTNSKTKMPDKTLTIEYYNKEKSLDEIIIIWKNIIKENEFNKYVTTDLYKGIGWRATLNTYNLFTDYYETELYIASAGYGLIQHSMKISSYDATFTPRTLNSIEKFNKDKISNIKWWDNINTFQVDSFSDESYIFVILPHNYLIATQNFIKKLIKKHGKRVFIFRANQNEALSFMKKYTVEFDLRFNSYQTGTLSSLLSRSVLWLSKEIVEYKIPFEHHLFQEHIENKMKNYPQYKMPKREQLSEEKLIEKIEKMISNDAITSASRGLKKLRESGIACEQKRFSSLFKKVKSPL
ncbi:MAG TPA: hypothetical protein EYG90_00880 [Campylobacterales bacterium]|nr:hypothetical protein [Campylobacterales bacterium]